MAGAGVRPGAPVRVDGEPDVLRRIRYQLRIVQNMTGCSTSVLNVLLQKLQPFLKGCENVKKLQMTRVRARKESPLKRTLHGCVGCNSHVFGPQCPHRVCPRCGHERYDDNGNANEVVFPCVSLSFFTCIFFLVLMPFFLVACADSHLHVFVIFFLVLHVPTHICMCYLPTFVSILYLPTTFVLYFIFWVETKS